MDVIESIRIFRRVAQKESFSQVAVEFNLTQPTISKAIAKLEDHLGVTLFRRSTRGLSLTTEGQKLFLSSANVLEQFDLLMSSVKNEKFHLHGELRVTASLAFARLILAPLFIKFSKIHPNLKFHFQLSDGYVDLIENNIDIAIRIGELPDSSLKAFRVGYSRRSFFASQSYLKEFGTPKSLEELHNHRLLFYTRLSDRPKWSVTRSDGKVGSFVFEPFLQSDGSDLVREAVLQGVGITLLPTWMMIGNENLKVAALKKYEGPSSPIYIVSTGSQELNFKQRALATFLKNQFELIPTLSLRVIAS